jgi:hypothetical protein
MGASFCLNEAFTIRKEAPLVLRYLLHAHAGGSDPERAADTAEAFSARPGFLVEKATRPHRQFEVRRRTREDR